MSGYIDSIFEGIELPPPVAELMASYAFIFALSAVVGCCIMAFWGYKIFKFSLSIAGATVFGTIGGTVLGPLLAGAIGDALPGVNISAILGFVLALIGAIILGIFHKVGIFVSGAASGYLLGTVFAIFLSSLMPNVEFFRNQIGIIIISAIVALIIGVLSIFLFKFVYILVTSVGGMAIAALTVIMTVMHEPSDVAILISLAVGALIGIVAMIVQYRIANEY